MMRRIHILLLIVLCCSNGCNEQSGQSNGNIHKIQNPGMDIHQVKSIEIVSEGGELGYRSRLLISADSVNYSVQVAVDATKNTQHSMKNAPEDWEAIVKEIDLPDFEKAVDGASRQPVDGIDTRVSITTNTGTITRTNAYENKTWNYILGSAEKYDK
ncbi:MAG: hypothetical protein J7623_30425 [Chitinophaga sp.]|uniref:hypothetical protein n=1 Tax=Chitinophaga sp. TaxID=1869181 RepID=UPI001B0816CC|nr:hypothetical protein [Chitinophaga sp.]MBO9732997.1 hypothetical protein [Chitinophaga sp.]